MNANHRDISDAVERVPTGNGVIARGRDDFHIVRDQSIGRYGKANKWDAVKSVLTGFGKDGFHAVPLIFETMNGNHRHISDAVERVPTGDGDVAHGRDDFHIVRDQIRFVGGNPTVGIVNVVIPADSFCNVKVWTR